MLHEPIPAEGASMNGPWACHRPAYPNYPGGATRFLALVRSGRILVRDDALLHVVIEVKGIGARTR